MHIVHAYNKLLEEPARLSLLESAFPHDVLKQGPASHIFQGNAQIP